MIEPIGMTCLYKNGESKNFTPEQVEDGKKEGWQDTPQPVVKPEPVPVTAAQVVKNKLDPKRP